MDWLKRGAIYFKNEGKGKVWVRSGKFEQHEGKVGLKDKAVGGARAQGEPWREGKRGKV
jgi:hypothetical protein